MDFSFNRKRKVLFVKGKKETKKNKKKTNKVIRPKSRALALWEKSGRLTDEQALELGVKVFFYPKLNEGKMETFALEREDGEKGERTEKKTNENDEAKVNLKGHWMEKEEMAMLYEGIDK